MQSNARAVENVAVGQLFPRTNGLTPYLARASSRCVLHLAAFLHREQHKLIPTTDIVHVHLHSTVVKYRGKSTLIYKNQKKQTYKFSLTFSL